MHQFKVYIHMYLCYTYSTYTYICYAEATYAIYYSSKLPRDLCCRRRKRFHRRIFCRRNRGDSIRLSLLRYTGYSGTQSTHLIRIIGYSGTQPTHLLRILRYSARSPNQDNQVLRYSGHSSTQDT
jgi:hypothetical protein